MHHSEFIFFGGFTVLILFVLLFDLTVVGRKSHIVSLRESLIWTCVWVTLAAGFYPLLLYHAEKLHGIKTPGQLENVRQQFAPFLSFTGDFTANLKTYRSNLAMEFITGYLVEYSLSIDNVFVIMMVLSSFAVKPIYFKRVLFWGILGAIILRCIFIFAGAALIRKFEWILLIFGLFLVIQGIKIYINRNKTEQTEPHNHWLMIYLSKHLPVYNRYVRGHFFIKKKSKTYLTPLFLVLIMIEFTDLVFAFDSIPAIFAVTRDPFIVFFSNIFAIIGLRSLFFLLMRIVDKFHYLKVGIAFLLIFVGLKLLLHSWLIEIGFKTVYSLFIIFGIITLSILASLLFPVKKAPATIDI
jgi:tellurite resistance protein TerC